MSDTILLVGDSYTSLNIYYASRFLAPDPVIFVQNGAASLLVTSSMEAGRARKESGAKQVRTFDDYGFLDLVHSLGDRDEAFLEVIARVAEEFGGSVTVEGSCPVLYADHLRAHGIEIDVDGSLYRKERRRKSPEEIEAIAQAQAAAQRATARAIDILSESDDLGGILHYAGIPLTSERLRAEVEVALTRDGMDTAQTPIVAGGPGGADPHWIGSGPLRSGEPIIMDIFPRGRESRYYGDLTRTVVRGEPSDLLRSMYDSVLRGQAVALEMIKAGVNGKDVHSAVEDVFESDGFAGMGDGPRYIHTTGHGVGLDIHEPPNLGFTDIILEEGDVVTVEPGLYDPKLGGVRIEDTVAVTRDGIRNLTDFPKQLRI